MTLEEKYEPKRFVELVFADQIARNTCARYAQSKPYKHLMLWGPPGSAKTTTARVILRERFATANYDGLFDEFNAAELTPDDFEMLLNTAALQRVNTGEAILIINEFDEIEKEDQAKWRAWMDRQKWIKLIVTTNEKPGIQGVRQKLMPALLSRFECVELAPPSLQDWLPRAQSIFRQEGHNTTYNELEKLLGSFDGDIRNMLPIIESALDGLEAANLPAASAKPLLKVVSTARSEL